MGQHSLRSATSALAHTGGLLVQEQSEGVQCVCVCVCMCVCVCVCVLSLYGECVCVCSRCECSEGSPGCMVSMGVG